jgi:hypothetical protein
LDSNATLAVVKQFSLNNLGEVDVVAALAGDVIGECHQQAHILLIVLTLSKEVQPLG